VRRTAFTALLSLVLAVTASAAKALEIFFIDVEGGQATLIVTPAGQSLLIDAGYGGRFGGRDPERILEVVREARVERIDYLLITHFHPDHVGGVPELASKIPIGTFIDNGTPLGTDRMTAGGYRAYEPVRRNGQHIVAQPGARLPLDGIEVDVVSAGGTLLSTPLSGGGQQNGACKDLEDHKDDGTENFRSIGVMLRFGAFRFLDLGDLSGNTLAGLVCPTNLLGTASVYLVAHHGDYDSNLPALYSALRPRVAIMNNGVTKGGAPEAFKTLRAQRGLEDVWQLHASRNPGAENSAEDLIANIDDGSTSYRIKLTAHDDGSFSVANGRTGLIRMYDTAN
jgi:competence protein ComEC